MAPRARPLPVGITRVHPHTRRTLRTAADLAVSPNWVWRVRARRRGVGNLDRLYPQDVRESLQATLDYLQHERTTAVNDFRRDAARRLAGIFSDDIDTYLARRASTTDYAGRKHNLSVWAAWLASRLGATFKTTQITPALVELALEEWKHETTIRKKPDAKRQRRWSSATLRTRALHLSNLFGVLYPDLANPVLALKDRLPPKSPEVDKAQSMPVVMALLERDAKPAAHRTAEAPIVRVGARGGAGLREDHDSRTLVHSRCARV